MQRYKATICYDGTLFSGYQVQPGKRTVQSELEGALKKLHKGTEVKIAASGRTDAGVHAKGQVISFDSHLHIPDERWTKALNSLLPDDLVVTRVEKANPSFHARFDAVGKEYRYCIQLATVRDPFTRNYAYQFAYRLDVDKMKEAALHLLGTKACEIMCTK